MFRRWFGGSTTDRLYARGLECLHRGELRAAVEAFEQSLDQGDGPDHPTTALASFYKAEAHARLGRGCLATAEWEAALAELDQALTIQPNFPDLHFCSGLGNYQLGRAHDALRCARRALDFNPRYVEAEALVHLCHLELSERVLAEQSLQRCAEMALERDEPVAALLSSAAPVDRQTVLEMLLDSPRKRERIEHATSLLEQGFWEEAKVAFERLVGRHPHYPDLRVKLAKCLYRLSDFDAAMEHLRQALQHRPGLVQANILMGVLQLAQHSIEDAKGCFERALHSDARSTFARYGLAATAVLSDDLAAAQPLAESLVREHPDSAVALRLLCLCRSLRGDAEGSLEILARWSALTDDDAAAMLDQIAVALRHGRVDLARICVGKLPDGAADAATALARARIAARAGDPRRALELLQMGRERLGAPVSLALEAAELALEVGDAPMAVDLLEPLSGRIARSRVLLARALRRSGRGDEAARLLTEGHCLSLDAGIELLLARRIAGDRSRADAAVAELMEIAPLELEVRVHDLKRWCEPFQEVARVAEAAH